MANKYQSIIVAVDGSKEADYAFRKSLDVAKRNEGAILNIVHVVENRMLGGVYNPTAYEQAQEQSEKILNDYKKQAEEEGLNNLNLIMEYGSPKSIIPNEAAESAQADLIICGATGINAVERFLIGLVSEAIVRSADCDVLVIRTPE